MDRENCIKKTYSLLVDIAEEGESKMNWESSINMYIYKLPCVKQIANRKLLYNTGA